MEPFGEELMYDGTTGGMIPTKMFLGNVFTMRLKHMPEDKWNARGEGRREQRTHQPTGGRGAQGGLRMGEMEVHAVLGHGTADFLRESIMKRADGYQTVVCNGCGTIPIYNEREKLYLCPMCDGPVKYIGETASNLEILPATRRSVVSFSRVEIPYAFKLLDQELNTYLNMGLRILTDRDLTKFRPPPIEELTAEQAQGLLSAPLPERVLPETQIPEYIPPAAEPEVRPEDLAAMGAVEEEVEEEKAADAPAVPVPTAAGNNQGGVVLQLGNMNVSMPTAEQQQQQPAPAPPVQGGGGRTIDIGDSDDDDIPFAPPAQSNSVTVQTTSQPVLIVPLSMNQAPAPTEVIPPPAPGAPNTIAVDTSPNAMKGIAPSRSVTPTNQNRGRSRSNSGNSGNASPNVNARVTVNKMGGGEAPPPAPSTRVSVNKLG
jgi:hypothetical protein